MGKRFAISLAVSIITLTFLVSAQIDLRQGSTQIIQWIEDLFEPFFSVFFGSGQYLFERTLLFVVILCISYVGISRFPPFQDKPSITWIITSIVAILSTRFLNEATFIDALLIPYSALGIILTSIIPLILFFFFIQSFENQLFRRILWILITLLFMGILLSRASDLGVLSWIYFTAALIALGFFIFDGTLRRLMIRSEYRQLEHENRGEFERNIRRQMREAREDLDEGLITDSEFRRQMRRLRNRLRAIRHN